MGLVIDGDLPLWLYAGLARFYSADRWLRVAADEGFVIVHTVRDTPAIGSCISFTNT